MVIFWMGRLGRCELELRRDCGRDWGKVPLTYHPCTHDNCAASIPIVFAIVVVDETLVCLLAHRHCVFDSRPAGDGISAPGVYDHGSDTITLPLLEYVSRDCHRRGLELVGCEDGGGRARRFGSDEGEVVEAGVAWLYADVGAPRREAERVGTRSWHVFPLRGRNGALAGGCVCAELVLRGGEAGYEAGIGAHERHFAAQK